LLAPAELQTSPLHYACATGDVEGLHQLLSTDEQQYINSTDSYGRTPLASVDYFLLFFIFIFIFGG
jgi:ankyrin repeat protein